MSKAILVIPFFFVVAAFAGDPPKKKILEMPGGAVNTGTNSNLTAPNTSLVLSIDNTTGQVVPFNPARDGAALPIMTGTVLPFGISVTGSGNGNTPGTGLPGGLPKTPADAFGNEIDLQVQQQQQQQQDFNSPQFRERLKTELLARAAEQADRIDRTIEKVKAKVPDPEILTPDGRHQKRDAPGGDAAAQSIDEMKRRSAQEKAFAQEQAMIDEVERMVTKLEGSNLTKDQKSQLKFLVNDFATSERAEKDYYQVVQQIMNLAEKSPGGAALAALGPTRAIMVSETLQDGAANPDAVRETIKSEGLKKELGEELKEISSLLKSPKTVPLKTQPSSTTGSVPNGGNIARGPASVKADAPAEGPQGFRARAKDWIARVVKLVTGKHEEDSKRVVASTPESAFRTQNTKVVKPETWVQESAVGNTELLEALPETKEFRLNHWVAVVASVLIALGLLFLYRRKQKR